MILNKLKNIIQNRFLRTPDLKFLKNNKEVNKKINYINFWLNKSSNNINFKKYFFEPSRNLDSLPPYIFDNYKNSFSPEMLNSLKQNGIIVIKNALPEFEKNQVLELFSELKNENFSTQWARKPTNESNNSFGKVKRIRGIIDIDKFSLLKRYSEMITQEVYGKKVNPTVEMHYIKLEEYQKETLSKGDTYLHTDRFLPHLKVFYTPTEITEDDAPFEYALSSHIIDNHYKSFFNKAINFDETSEYSEMFIKKTVKVIVPSNTLYVAFTNGFHKRNIFKKKGSERFMMYLQYVRNFNKINYIFG
jgi:hypothetical protein